MFSPILYISIGAKSCFFTLRETCEVLSGGQIVESSFHHFNLSQDPDEAIEKAKMFAENHGMPLVATKACLVEELNKITRANAEQRAAMILAEKIAEEKRAEQAKEAEKAKLDLIAAGKYPFGQYKGQEFREAPLQYINWLATSKFDEGSLGAEVSKAIRNSCQDLLLPVPNQAFIGTPSKRQAFSATVVNATGYLTDYGWTNIVTMVADSGECLLIKSAAFSANVGEKITFKATVKEHSEYKGQNQTIIQRIQVIQ